jgi:molecular chaperone GrpE
MTWKIYRHPSEPAGPVSDETTGQDVEPRPDAESTPKDQIEQLQLDLAAARTELEQLQDRFLRKAAEFENYRKRAEKEKLDSIHLAKSSVFGELLPIVDACERAIESLSKADASTEPVTQYREGVMLLYRKLTATLNRLGVTAVEAQGQPFDPHLHEALSREVTAEFEDNIVTRELRRGYKYGDRLLRPAQVVVSIRPEEEQPAGK